MTKVLITQPRNKEMLQRTFEDAGADLLSPEGSYIRPDLIVPTVDEELPTLAYLRPYFEAQGTKVAIASPETIKTCRDKYYFYKFLKRCGYDCPATPDFGHTDYLVKPRFGKGSRGQLKITREYIFQEFIDWTEYSIDYYKDDEVLSVVPRVRVDIVNGESQSALLVKDEKLIDEAKRLGEELKLEYHNVMQCFFDGKRIKWIEVNPRYGGGSWLTFDEFNSPKRLLELVKEKV